MNLLLWVAGGFACAVLLAKLWQMGQQTTATPEVTGRVVNVTTVRTEVDEFSLMDQLDQITADKAKRRAYDRGVERMIEAKASEVRLPWGVGATDPPKS